jgi:hypothetical protein
VVTSAGGSIPRGLAHPAGILIWAVDTDTSGELRGCVLVGDGVCSGAPFVAAPDCANAYDVVVDAHAGYVYWVQTEREVSFDVYRMALQDLASGTNAKELVSTSTSASAQGMALYAANVPTPKPTHAPTLPPTVAPSLPPVPVPTVSPTLTPVPTPNTPSPTVSPTGFDPSACVGGEDLFFSEYSEGTNSFNRCVATAPTLLLCLLVLLRLYARPATPTATSPTTSTTSTRN